MTSVQIPLSTDPSTVALILKRGIQNDLLACATSKKEALICDIGTAKPLFAFSGHLKRITGLCWASPQLILSSSSDGSARIWDIRTRQQAGAFTFPPDPTVPQTRIKGYHSIGTNSQNLVAAGLEAAVHLWDSRVPDKLYASWWSVTKDVTSLLFHPLKPNMLLAGTEDGIITIFDAAQTDEDEAFVDALHMERAIEDMGFFGPSSEYLWSTSLTRDLALWSLNDDTEHKIVQFDSSIISALEKVSGEPIFSLLSCCYSNLEQCFLLFTATLSGAVVIFEIKEHSIEFKTKLQKGHTDLARVSVWLDDLGIFATGAEDNSIRFWKAR